LAISSPFCLTRCPYGAELPHRPGVLGHPDYRSFGDDRRSAATFYVATTKFQPTAFLQLGHLGKVSPTATVARSWSAQSLR
jgi:hypothetical protein